MCIHDYVFTWPLTQFQFWSWPVNPSLCFKIGSWSHSSDTKWQLSHFQFWLCPTDYLTVLPGFKTGSWYCSSNCCVSFNSDHDHLNCCLVLKQVHGHIHGHVHFTAVPVSDHDQLHLICFAALSQNWSMVRFIWLLSQFLISKLVQGTVHLTVVPVSDHDQLHPNCCLVSKQVHGHIHGHVHLTAVPFQTPDHDAVLSNCAVPVCVCVCMCVCVCVYVCMSAHARMCVCVCVCAVIYVCAVTVIYYI